MNQNSLSLWNYSTSLYQQKGIGPACLSLQDQYGLDVNLILFCLWYGELFGKLTNNQLSQLLEISNHWSKLTVIPLRTVRRSIKSDTFLSETAEFEEISNWREKVKNLELEAEKIQQNMLEGMARTSWPNQGAEVDENSCNPLTQSGNNASSENDPDCGRHNLSLLLAAMDLKLSCSTQTDLLTILAGRQQFR